MTKLSSRAWLLAACGIGLTVALALAVAATRRAGDTTSSPLHPEGNWSWILSASLIGGFLLYLAALFLLRRETARAAWIAVAVGVVLQLLPLASPLLLSRDVYIYWDYGRIGAVHGGNPYVDVPSDFPDDPAYPLIGADWRDTRDAYGPLWTLTAEAQAKWAGDSPAETRMAYKVIAAVGMLVLLAAVGWFARRRAEALVLVGWNPLLPLHFAGGGHNDAWMMAFTVAALGFCAARRPNLAGAVWVLAVAVKWFPLMLLPLELLRGRRPGWRGALAAGLLLGGLATWRFGIAWWHAAGPLSNQLQRASSISIPKLVLIDHGVGVKTAAAIFALLFFAAYVWLAWQAWRGRTRMALTTGLFALSLAWIVPWYGTWPLALSALEDDDRTARILAIALSAWLLRDALPL